MALTFHFEHLGDSIKLRPEAMLCLVLVLSVDDELLLQKGQLFVGALRMADLPGQLALYGLDVFKARLPREVQLPSQLLVVSEQVLIALQQSAHFSLKTLDLYLLVK